jgi:hypothetical protein
MTTGYAPGATRVEDSEQVNNTAPVQVAENDSFSCALPKDHDGGVGGWAVGAGVLAIVGSVLLVVRYRRRKISPSGPAKTA